MREGAAADRNDSLRSISSLDGGGAEPGCCPIVGDVLPSLVRLQPMTPLLMISTHWMPWSDVMLTLPRVFQGLGPEGLWGGSSKVGQQRVRCPRSFPRFTPGRR